jgi:hypothetical protein
MAALTFASDVNNEQSALLRLETHNTRTRHNESRSIENLLPNLLFFPCSQTHRWQLRNKSTCLTSCFIAARLRSFFAHAYFCRTAKYTPFEFKKPRCMSIKTCLCPSYLSFTQSSKLFCFALAVALSDWRSGAPRALPHESSSLTYFWLPIHL